jgi:signal peptidase I
MQDLRIKQRKPGLAAWLNCLAPGLGMIYLGQQRQAIIHLLLVVLPWFVLLLLPWRSQPQIIAAAGVISLLMFITIMLRCHTEARRQAPVITAGQRLSSYLLLWTGFMVLICLWLALSVFQLGLLPYQIHDNSMQPTLSEGDWVLMNWRDTGLETLGYGDIVQFTHPISQQPALQRLIAVPGERVTVHGGGLFIDGKWQPESYISDSLNRKQLPEGVVEMTVPSAQLFLLADNRDNRRDSRYWGAVPAASVTAKVVYRVDWQQVWGMELLPQFTSLSNTP